MKRWSLFRLVFLLALGGALPGRAQSRAKHWDGPGNPLKRLLRTDSARFGSVLRHPDAYRVQILYTRIRRDARGRPHFRRYGYRLRPREYFYPASTVKLPTAVVALAKLRGLRPAGPDSLTRETPLRIDSAFAGQTPVLVDRSAPLRQPTIGNYIRKVLLVSDNDAFNRLYEFVGQGPLNDQLRQHGLGRTRIIHRLAVGDAEPASRHTNPFAFFADTTAREPFYHQPAAFNAGPLPRLRATGYRLGRAHLAGGQRVAEPLDFSAKNAFPLSDQQRVLRAILFPAAVPRRQRFGALRPADYAFLRQYLWLPPGQSNFPRYDPVAYPGAYAKFLLAGGAGQLPAGVRSYNKIGQAYGFLIDNAYLTNEAAGVEFLLSAVVYVNANGVLNDDQYEYDTVGLPFLRELGQAVYEQELARASRRSRRASPVRP
ncbi:serine hydrolase [Hymenobacter amundsenii]|nr:serine hydrolase [Hymenobacter amundsenii]